MNAVDQQGRMIHTNDQTYDAEDGRIRRATGAPFLDCVSGKDVVIVELNLRGPKVERERRQPPIQARDLPDPQPHSDLTSIQ
ncbi:hypothetical protein P154DRAFT_573802 [Amniculicola lignicola CBS 123094]|uniref:Uncharacterized protein n=1 Tax=Amniculicola lignicola CBS 123094 TaxID=1392246 RepID=A0A6A5WKY2_9PLEO|nr:hypothetical protein P154DRAFT_573802 [Amniculicola lignicola CBS 123094]